MKIKREVSITLIIIVALAICIYVGYLSISKNNSSSERISKDTKEKITSIIKNNKGKIPNLQVDISRARWDDEGHNKQKKMMDQVLDSLKVVDETREGKPNKCIISTAYDNMQLYIPYSEKTPYKKLVIEIDSHYYVATAKESDVNAIVDYMKKQGVLGLLGL